MGFGNPYGDLYSEEIVFDWVNKITALDVKIISLSRYSWTWQHLKQVFSITNYLD